MFRGQVKEGVVRKDDAKGVRGAGVLEGRVDEGLASGRGRRAGATEVVDEVEVVGFGKPPAFVPSAGCWGVKVLEPSGMAALVPPVGKVGGFEKGGFVVVGWKYGVRGVEHGAVGKVVCGGLF